MLVQCNAINDYAMGTVIPAPSNGKIMVYIGDCAIDLLNTRSESTILYFISSPCQFFVL